MTDFLTVDEIAQTLKVTRQTVAKYIQRGNLPAIKINQRYRVLSSEFDKFLSSNALVPGPVYFRNSRNCVLDYEGKTGEQEILTSGYTGAVKPVEINHGEKFNKFIFGDNFYVLHHLAAEYRGNIDLVYIDPPYGTGQDFANLDNNHAYSDRLLHTDFLEFLRKRLFLLRELLSENGSIYLHIDKKIGHYVKIIMDEVFGYNNFINDITRIKCNPKNFARNAYGNYSDIILFYAKERDKNIWNEVREELTGEEEAIFFPKIHAKFGRYTTNPLHAPGETLDGDTGKAWKGLKPPKGRHWRYSREELSRLDEKGLVEWSDTGNPRKIIFAKDHKGKKVQDVWEFKDRGLSYVNYPTQKNHDMLKRIISNSSHENSIVLDCFAGSGSTLLVADELNRKWIGADNSIQSLSVVKSNFKKAGIKCNFFEYMALD